MSIALHILAYYQSVVGWQLVLNYMWTPQTHFYLESSGWTAYMETHPNLITITTFYNAYELPMKGEKRLLVTDDPIEFEK